MVGRIGDAMYESVVLNIIHTCILKIVSLYKNSKASAAINFISRVLKRCVDGSLIWRFIKSPEKTSAYQEESFILSTIQSAIDGFILILKKIYDKLKPYLDGSLSGRVLYWISGKIAPAICIFIFTFVIIPHKNWHNHYGTYMVAFITLLFILRAVFDNEFKIDFRKMDFTFVLFVIASLFAAVLSIMPKDSIRTFILGIVPIVLLFVMVNTIKYRDDLDIVLLTIIASVTLTSLYGLWQYMNNIPVDPLLVDLTIGQKAVGRVFSTMGNPNNYAGILILTLPLYGAVFFNSENINIKITTAFLSVFPVLSLAFTYSRACYIGFAVSILTYVFLKNRKWIPVLISFGFLAIPFIPRTMVERMYTIGKDTSSLYRIEIWKGSIRMLIDYWVTGVGPGVGPFTRLFRSYSLAALPAHSHMFPMQIWLETGVAGFIASFWFVGRIVKKGIASIFRHEDRYKNNIMIACISSFAGIFTVGMVEYIWFYPRVMNMFFIVAGIFLSVIGMTKEQEGVGYGQE